MLIYERQQRVLEMLRQQRTAVLDELAKAMGVSASTIRRDLERLEERGLVERTHGGAVYTGDRGPNNTVAQDTPPAEPTGFGDRATPPTVGLAERMATEVAAKQAIAQAAARLVEPNMTLLLDGGSSVVYAAQQITARPLQVVTNSLSIANIFASDERVELLMVGGSLYPRTETMVGPIALKCLADVLMFSLAGIYDTAAFNINLAMAQGEQLMMQQAATRVMLMDASKFGRKSLVRVCGIEEVEHIITDPGIAPTWRERLGQRLIVAGGV